MFTLFVTPLVALFAAQSVYGIVTPTGPGGSEVFKAGSQCLTSWKGDTDSNSPWKSMDIELMSGDNFHMVHVTTVATNQDGTKDNQFSFPCPDITPFSAIYFYQYTATGAPPTWTTRFTIAAEDGSTTPPANSTQPDGKAIPWGVGQLTDQSKVVPPPASAGGASSGSSSPPVDAASSSSSSSSSSPAPAAAGSSTSVAVAGTTAAATVGETSASSPSVTSASRFVTSTLGSAAAQSTAGTASAGAANSTSTSKPGSGAVSLTSGWKVASLTAGVAVVFGLLL